MGKFLGRKKAKPGEPFFGGRGVIIPRPLPSTPVEPTRPATGEAPLKQPGPLKPESTC